METYGEFATEVRVSGDRFRLMQLRRRPGIRPLTYEIMPKDAGKKARQEWIPRANLAGVIDALEAGARGELGLRRPGRHYRKS